MRRSIITCLFLLYLINMSSAQEFNPLWPDGIPNHQGSDEKEIQEQGDVLWVINVQEPGLEIYLPTPQSASGKAVIICPGGGYAGLAYDWEGRDIAKWFNSKGIAAFILKYRLPQSRSVIVSYEAPLQDAQRAVRMVRQNAASWGVNKNQIGVMGFSAGGHLASTLGTHYNHKNNFNQTPMDTISARPDFMILMYPVITMKAPYVHEGSRDNLLGKNPGQELIELFSNEGQINSQTPPTFIVHATDDTGVPVENSLMFYQGLKNAGVPVEMHIYPYGGHGFALAIGKGYLHTWTDRLYDWIQNLQ